MEILKTDIYDFDENVIDNAINILASGGVVLYPTDTVYGLGVNIFNNKAVRRVFDIKQRSLLKPLSILISDMCALDLVADVPDDNKKIMENYFPGPYTFILNKTNYVPRVVTSGSTHVGVRIPDNEISRKLSSLFPITTTSANLSDKPVLSTPSEILNQLNCDVDLVIDVGELNSKKASTIIDLTGDEFKIIRR